MNDNGSYARIIRSSPILKPLVPAAAIWLIGVLGAFLVGVDEGVAWSIIQFSGSALAAYTFWRSYKWSDQWARYISFGGAMLIALFANRLLYIADVIVSGPRYSIGPVVSDAPEWFVFKAEIITVIGTFLTVVLWMLAGGTKYSPRAMLDIPSRRLTRALWVVYLVSLLVLFVITLYPELDLILGQSLQMFLSIGIGSCFFLPQLVTRKPVNSILTSAVLAAPFGIMSLGSGMKEGIILSVLPVGYSLWLLVRSIFGKSILVIGAVLFLAVVSSFTEFYRAETWYKQRQLSSQQAVVEYLGVASIDGFDETIGKGLQEFLNRSNSSIHRGWAVAIADNNGFEPNLVFDPLLYVFIPRILWADKPLIQQGWEYSGLLFGLEYISWSGSSTAAGVYPALYLGYGWVAVVSGAVVLGIAIAWLFKLAARIGGELMVGLFVFSLLPYALRLDENWTVGALSGPIVRFAYLAAFFLIVRWWDTFRAQGARRIVT